MTWVATTQAGLPASVNVTCPLAAGELTGELTSTTAAKPCSGCRAPAGWVCTARGRARPVRVPRAARQAAAAGWRRGPGLRTTRWSRGGPATSPTRPAQTSPAPPPAVARSRRPRTTPPRRRCGPRDRRWSPSRGPMSSMSLRHGQAHAQRTTGDHARGVVDLVLDRPADGSAVELPPPLRGDRLADRLCGRLRAHVADPVPERHRHGPRALVRRRGRRRGRGGGLGCPRRIGRRLGGAPGHQHGDAHAGGEQPPHHPIPPTATNPEHPGSALPPDRTWCAVTGIGSAVS